MKRNQIRRPEGIEFHPYYNTYISKVESENFFEELKKSCQLTCQLLPSLTHDQWNYRYAPGKWSIKEVLLHIIDTERIFAYRALRIARNDMTPIEGFEQDEYIPFLEADHRTPSSIIDEYRAVRKSTLELFRNFTEDMLSRVGTASERPFTPLAIGFIIAGHEIHHLNIITDRYLV